jgi:solute carrier family 25 S-adenosylmethionine transporter 26
MKDCWGQALPPVSQGLAPSLAAVSGNAASSLIFVPKEVLKQRCQVGQLRDGQQALGLLREIVKTEGVGAMYNGYFATLLRNAPGAMLKFGIYEQIKTALVSCLERPLTSPELFGAGITAGCVSSFATTPLDVVKTRMMLGQMPSQFPLRAIMTIGREEGVRALWSGFVPRLIWSATFFAVGISTYETVLARVIKTVVVAPPGRGCEGDARGRQVKRPGDAEGPLDKFQNFYSSTVDKYVMATR